MTWFVLALAPPWMFFTVLGINLVAAILRGGGGDDVDYTPAPSTDVEAFLKCVAEIRK